MVKKYVCLLIAIVLALGTFTIVQASSDNREPVESSNEAEEVLGVCLMSIVNREKEEALMEEFGTTNPLEIGEEPYTRFLNSFVDGRNERVQNFHAYVEVAIRTDALSLINREREEVVLEAFGVTNVIDFSSVVNMRLEEALLEEFGTTDPLVIGEEPYVRFFNNFVDRHNERVDNIRIDASMPIRADNFDIIEIAPASVCLICGSPWRPPRVVTEWGRWWATGRTRSAGAWPNLHVEYEQHRSGTMSNVMNCCNIFISSAGTTSQTRWVPDPTWQ